ncbi:hypothetical protein [Synechococcus sp. M16CYN]|uniref:hypothetical protein n=1 Tax=Synechococcus sp. M16CYN TaxID=3103139 RepID=UPI00333E3674
MSLSSGSFNSSVSSPIEPSQAHEQTWDAVETYFECITTCSLDDGECITRCVDQLRDSDKDE